MVEGTTMSAPSLVQRSSHDQTFRTRAVASYISVLSRARGDRSALVDIRALNDYSSRVRRKFLAKLSSLGWEEAVRNREASHYSLVGIMLHMIDNEDWIVNIVIPGKPAAERRRHLPSEFAGFEGVEALLAEVEAKTKLYLESMDTGELGRNVKYPAFPAADNMTVEEWLFQSFTEQLYHLGELIALFWQDDVEPPQMQWFNNRESLSLSSRTEAQ